MPMLAAEMEQEIKDDLQAGLWEMVNSSALDLGVQIPTVEVGDEAVDDYNSMESQDPHCPWYEEDTRFDSFSSEKIESKIETDKERFLLGIFPYGPNNQIRGFRDTMNGEQI